ncbi:WD40/YVTN/BNR-like repeat-containing protein [Streptomyces himalayensis]|uniref:Exo-alpha-sialidase n=1 Tax=Streptomyces himalayensis subsp. himalayensis TaxID=2756131 RepID=A0A7W0DR22_9ACTN|nr:exo-alpha-sialidase [Streptomyces himalayensis]MBA2949672.1 exo-alpha-sialidase [Streptomyces himalayensis subsp. himalayensis]
MSVAFADEHSGFAVMGGCTGQETEASTDDDHACRQHVAVLEDGKWRLGTSPLPDPSGGDGFTADIFALGPGRASITAGTGRNPDRTWFTDDGARTWKSGTTRVTGTVRAVPESAQLTWDCLKAEEQGGCGRSRLVVTMPDSGRRKALAAQPPLAGVVLPAGSSNSGALWASGLDARTGASALAVSHDQGRTWRASKLPGPKATTPGWGLQVVEGQDALYAAEPGQLPEEEEVKNGLRALYRSTDGGRSWARVWTYRPGHEPLSILGDPVAATDGSLTIHGESGVYRSTDGGRSFRRTADAGPPGAPSRTPIGYLGSLGQGSYEVSADGIHWHTFTLGG